MRKHFCTNIWNIYIVEQYLLKLFIVCTFEGGRPIVFSDAFIYVHFYPPPFLGQIWVDLIKKKQNLLLYFSMRKSFQMGGMSCGWILEMLTPVWAIAKSDTFHCKLFSTTHFIFSPRHGKLGVHYMYPHLKVHWGKKKWQFTVLNITWVTYSIAWVCNVKFVLF